MKARWTRVTLALASVLACALTIPRIHEDPERFLELVRTLHLFGVPIEHAGQRRFLRGGALGDAIMLAMLTAGPGTAQEPGTP